MQNEPKTPWYKKAWRAYDAFCKELGLDKGACRGCMPRVEFDEEGRLKKEPPLEKLEK